MAAKKPKPAAKKKINRASLAYKASTAEPQQPAVMGRPSIYTNELAEKICDLVAQRIPLIHICARDDMPNKDTIYRWKRERQDFSDLYAQARQHRACARADYIDQVLEEARDGTVDVQVARLIVDAEKWQMAKEMPRLYSDKVLQEITGKDGKDLIPENTDNRDLARTILDILRESGKKE